MNSLPYCVIGSGPSSISSAVALLKHGLNVVMLDVGKELDDNKKIILRRISTNTKDDSNEELLKELYTIENKDNQNSKYSKLSYGSEFFYEENKFSNVNNHDELFIKSSFAKGGLSNVWGAALQPYETSDFKNWPISETDLKPHYQAVYDFMPTSKFNDPRFNFCTNSTPNSSHLNISSQIIALKNHLLNSRNSLNLNGISFDDSLLALSNSKSNINQNCIYCGNCMNGCQKQLIYNSKFTLEELIKNPKFTYLPNVKVIKFEESADKVSLFCINTKFNTAFSMNYAKVYIGCGVIGSARIYTNSFNLHNKFISIKDSQYFYFPLIQRDFTSDSTKDIHALCQLFMKIKIFEGTDFSHLQLYTINKTFEYFIHQKFKLLKFFPKQLIRKLFNRTLLVQGYLPSELSSTINVKFSFNNLSYYTDTNWRSIAAIYDVGNTLNRHSTNIGIFKIPLKLIHIGTPGSGNHLGSSFPMSKQVRELCSDSLGRILNTKRVHCIDSSILPSIPSGPITLNVMANAHRIASAYDQ